MVIRTIVVLVVLTYPAMAHARDDNTLSNPKGTTEPSARHIAEALRYGFLFREAAPAQLVHQPGEPISLDDCPYRCYSPNPRLRYGRAAPFYSRYHYPYSPSMRRAFDLNQHLQWREDRNSPHREHGRGKRP